MTKNYRIALLFAGLLVIAVLAWVFAANLVDFPVYYAAGRSLLSGRTDLFSSDFALGRVMDYRYPPFFLLALSPLCLLPYSIAAYLWCLLQTAAVAACAIIVSRACPISRARITYWSIVTIAVAQYFVMALHYGNAHILVILLLFASMYLLLRGRDGLAALPLALAITIKLIPLLLVPYFVLKRRWRLLIAVGLLLVVINTAPASYFGFTRNSELLAEWYNHVVASQEFHERNGPIDLSLKGQLRRYLSTVDYSERVDGDVNYPVFNIANLSDRQIVETWVLIATLSFAVILWIIYGRSRRFQSGGGSSQMDPLGIGLMICLLLMVGPLTSKIYFIALLWPVAALAKFVTDREESGVEHARYILMFVALVNFVLPLLPGRWVQRWLLVLGVDFFVNCLLMTALAYALAARSRSSRLQFGELQTPVRSEARAP